MQERNLLGTAGGQAGVSVLQLQDVAAIPLLALLPLLAEKLSSNMHLSLVNKGFVAIKIVFVIGGVIVGGRAN